MIGLNSVVASRPIDKSAGHWGRNVQYRIGAVWRLAGICTSEASAAAIELSLMM